MWAETAYDVDEPLNPASEDDRKLPHGSVGYSQALRQIGSTPKSKPDPAKHRRMSEAASSTADNADDSMGVDPDAARPMEDAPGFEPYFVSGGVLRMCPTFRGIITGT